MAARIAGIVIVLALLASSLTATLSGRSLFASAEGIRFLLARDWAIAAVLLAIGLLWERQRLSSFGVYRPTWRDLALGVAGFVVGVLAFGLSGLLVHALHLNDTSAGIAELLRMPIALRGAIVLTTGITEEIIFRGYLFERVAALTRNVAAGAIASLVIFGAAHIGGWGLGGAIQITLWTIVITALYAYSRRLLPCVIMHMLNDAFAFMVIPLLMLRR